MVGSCDHLLLLVVLGLAGWSLLHWLLVGADWSVVTTNLPLYAVGSFLRINAYVLLDGSTDHARR